jgi:hypothetical protein
MLKDGPSSRLLFGKRIEGPVQKLLHIMKAAALDSFAQATFEFRRMDFDAHLKVSLALIIAEHNRRGAAGPDGVPMDVRKTEATSVGCFLEAKFVGPDFPARRSLRAGLEPDAKGVCLYGHNPRSVTARRAIWPPLAKEPRARLLANGCRRAGGESAGGRASCALILFQKPSRKAALPGLVKTPRAG